MSSKIEKYEKGRNMMLSCPKGYKYWCKNGSDLTIKPDAPCWVKKEFKNYIRLFKENGKPDKNGIIRYY